MDSEKPTNDEIVQSIQTVQCPDCFTKTRLAMENMAVGKCRGCGSLLPFDDDAAEMIAEGVVSMWDAAAEDSC